MKTCKQCNKKKPLSDFYRHKFTKDGYLPICKDCHLKNSKKYHQSPKGRKVHNNANKKYRQTEKGRAAVKRAKPRREEYQKTEKFKISQNKYYLSEKGKTAQKKSWLYRKYRLTVEQHKQMYLNQNGCCAVCGESIPYEKITVDHNHKTDEVRKLLCNKCNAFVGYVEKYPELLNSIVKYLKL